MAVDTEDFASGATVQSVRFTKKGEKGIGFGGKGKDASIRFRCAFAQQAGVSEPEIIRQAIDLHLGEITVPQTNLAIWEAEREFIDQIKTRPAQLGGRNWQREDLY